MLQCQQREGVSCVLRGYSQGCTGSLSRSIVVGTHAGGTRISRAECRHKAIPTDGSCCGYSVCVVCNMSGQWCLLTTSEVSASPWFSTLPLTQFLSQCISKTCSKRGLWYSWTWQAPWEARRVTMTNPSPLFFLQLEESSGTSQKIFGRPAKVCKYVKEGRKLCDRPCAWTKITCGQLTLVL